MARTRPPAFIFVPRPTRKKIFAAPNNAAIRALSDAVSTTLNLSTNTNPTSSAAVFDDKFDDRPYKAVRSDAELEGLPQLWEGNFDTWVQGAERQLIAKRLWAPSPGNGAGVADVGGRSAWYDRDKEVVRLLMQYIRPGTADRVSLHDMHTVADFIAYLGRLATSFRLLDLPAELRTLVYNVALQSQGPITIFERQIVRANDREHVRLRVPGSLPALLRVSRKLRNEASAVYYSVNAFTIVLNGLASYELPLADMVKWYQKSKVPFRHLRKMILKMKSPATHGGGVVWEAELTVRYLPSTGLQLDTTNINLTDALELRRRALEQHGAANGLDGEALVLFFSAS